MTLFCATKPPRVAAATIRVGVSSWATVVSARLWEAFSSVSSCCRADSVT